jgi:hypothetical protein
MASRNIVDVGKFLQKYGLNIGEHPEFGGVGGGHSPTGYHPVGMAIDVRDWRPDVAPAYEGGKPKPWKQRTGELSWRAKQLGLFNEALGPGDKGHDTHVHLALEGTKPITEQQLEWLATGRYKTPEGKLTDVMPGAMPAQTAAPAQTTNANEEAVNKLLAELTKQPSVQDVLISKALENASARRAELMSLVNVPQASFMTPQQAMEMFS